MSFWKNLKFINKIYFNNKYHFCYHEILNKSHLILIIAACIFSSGRGKCEEIPEYFSSPRSMGMGDAFTAIAQDEGAVWTNPAGIGRVRKARSRHSLNLVKIPNIIAGTNRDGYHFTRAFRSTGEKSVSELITGSEGLSDKPFWSRAGAFPITMFDVEREIPMAVGLLTNTTAKIIIPKETPEVAKVEAIADVGGVISLGFTSVNNRFNVGFQTRPLARYAFEERIPSQDLTNRGMMTSRFKEGANKSQAIAIDAGILMTIGDFWFPTIGAAVLNVPTGCKSNYLNPFTEKFERVCGTVYSGSFANEDALSTVDPTDLRIGLSITPRLSQKVALRLALDAHHLPLGDSSRSYGLQGIEVNKLMHAGAELVLGNPLLVSPFSIRAGYSQGFPTGGFGVNWGLFVFEGAIYGRDVSSSSSPIADIRYLTSMSFDF